MGGLRRLAAYLRESGSATVVDEIRTPLLRRYLLEMQQAHGFKPRTVARKVFTLRSFFAYCREQEYCVANPAVGLKAPPPPKAIPAYLTREELARQFDVAERTRGRGAARTYEAMVKTLAWTGMRREELCRLTWDDVNFEQQTITVRDGKGGKDGVIPMHRQLSDHLWGYLQAQLPLRGACVFLTATGAPYGPKSVDGIVEKLLRRAGIAKVKMGPHVLRHTIDADGGVVPGTALLGQPARRTANAKRALPPIVRTREERWQRHASWLSVAKIGPRKSYV